MKIGRMTWAGFGIALIGWILLIIDLVASDALIKAGSLVSTLSLRSDIVTLAQTVILSGFGLAIVGTLRAGFGAFTRFFDAVLQRSTSPRPKSSTVLEPEPVAPEPVRTPDPATPRAPEVITVTPTVVTPERPSPHERPAAEKPAAERAAPPERPKPPRSKERNFVILSDGSVEVETMFGTRIFATMDEAKDFIR